MGLTGIVVGVALTLIVYGVGFAIAYRYFLGATFIAPGGAAALAAIWPYLVFDEIRAEWRDRRESKD